MHSRVVERKIVDGRVTRITVCAGCPTSISYGGPGRLPTWCSDECRLRNRNCPDCGDSLPVNRKNTYCRPCSATRARQWYDSPKGKAYSNGYRAGYRERRRFLDVKRRLGITEQEYRDLFARFDGKCGACGGPGECVDHHHATGVVRGILCHRCNRVAGMVTDNPDVAEGIATYLRVYGV